MPEQEETTAGEEAWALLEVALDYDEPTVLPKALTLFDAALADRSDHDAPLWRYGRAVIHAAFARDSGDPADWTRALDDLWQAWAVPHTAIDRDGLAADLAEALVERAVVSPDDDPGVLDRLNADFDRLDDSGSPSVAAVRIGRGLARLARWRQEDGQADHDEGLALLRTALPEAPDDTPALGMALYNFALVSVVDDDLEQALAAIERLRSLMEPGDQDAELDELESDLLDAVYRKTDDPAVENAMLDRLERLCSDAAEPPPDALLSCGEMRLFRAIRADFGQDNGPGLDAAVGWLERAADVVSGEQVAVCQLLLGMSLNRRFQLTKDDGDVRRAVACLDDALSRGLPSGDVELTAHQERLNALMASFDEDSADAVRALDPAFADAMAAAAAHPDADLGCRAELAMALARTGIGLGSHHMEARHLAWIQRHLDLAGQHPKPPTEWSTLLATLRALAQVLIDGVGDGNGDFGLSTLAQALRDTQHFDLTGAPLRRLIGLQAMLANTRSGALHSLRTASVLLPEPGASPMDRFLAAWTDLGLCKQLGGDDAQLLAAVDAAIAAAAQVDPASPDGRTLADFYLPMLHALRLAGDPTGSPLPELQPLTSHGEFYAHLRTMVELMRDVVSTAAGASDPLRQEQELEALEQRVRTLPDGLIFRLVGVGLLLSAWVDRAERRKSHSDAARAIAWVPQALEFVGGPEHPLFKQVNDQAAKAHRLRGLPDDLQRSRQLALAALRGQAWMVLLQSGTEHAVGLARSAAADAIRIARWCLADRAAEDLVAALDAGRGLVLQAAVTTRGIADRLLAAGEDDLAREWTATGGDDRITVDVAPDLDLHSDLRRRVLRALAPDHSALQPPSTAQIKAALTTQCADALIYLVPADAEEPGLAVVVPAREPVEVLELPELDADAAATLARRMGLTAGRDIGPTDARTGCGLADLMDWAWRVAGSELYEAAYRLGASAERPPHLVLVPFGPLALVPWHAARPADGSGPGLLERAVVSYVPSAQLLCRAQTRPRRPDGDALVVGNPTGDLPEAGAEARCLVGSFYPAATYLGCAGTSEPGAPEPSGRGDAVAVLDLLRTDAQPLALLHLACHARADPAAPWRSSLLLADRLVDVGELLTLRRAAPLDIDTVFLAGCSTNVAGVDHDEAFSLASGFLAAGARTAFGSMWTVPDDHTSRLMFMVHHFLVREGCSPAVALHRAQLWSADPHRVPPPTMPAALARSAVGADDPIAWAGFQHLGA